MQQARSRDAGASDAPAGSRTEPESQLNDEQWFLIEDLFANPQPSAKGGRPRQASRRCVEGILWILRSGARWKDLPKCFPSPVTCWRRHREWTESGIWQQAWARLLGQLDRQGQLNWNESTADGTFSSAKKGANSSARPNAARGPRSWSIAKGMGCRWPRRSPALVPTKLP